MSSDAFDGPRSRPNVLAGLRLDELQHGVQERLAEIVQIRDQMQVGRPWRSRCIRRTG